MHFLKTSINTEQHFFIIFVLFYQNFQWMSWTCFIGFSLTLSAILLSSLHLYLHRNYLSNPLNLYLNLSWALVRHFPARSPPTRFPLLAQLASRAFRASNALADSAFFFVLPVTQQLLSLDFALVAFSTSCASFLLRPCTTAWPSVSTCVRSTRSLLQSITRLAAA